MKVLMISLDASLSSEQPIGDVLERMQDYAREVDELDVLVLGPSSAQKKYERLRIIGSGGVHKLTRFFRGWRKAAKLARDKDIITAQDPFFAGLLAYLASRRRQIPLVIDVHGDFWGDAWRQGRKISGFFLLKLGKFLLKRANQVRVVNPKIQEDIERVGVDFKKIHCLPVPVDLHRFEKYNLDRVKRIREETSGGPILLFVGRLSLEKGIHYLIEALSIFKKTCLDAKLIVVGEGPYREFLEKRVKNEGLQDSVWFVGKVGVNEIVDYYQTCDIFVLPSSHESYGRVILEAAMAKKPVVATNTIGARSHIRDNSYFPNDPNEYTGYLVPPHNSYKLAKALEQVWADYPKAQAAAERLYQQVKLGYDYQRSVSDITQLWQNAAL